MPAKKKVAPKKVTRKVTKKVTGGVTSTTWILFTIFLVVSYFCLKTVFAVQQLNF